jgi:hypothetical protein
LGYLALLSAVFFIAENFNELLGFWVLIILFFITIVPLALEMHRVKPSLFIYSKTRRKQKEIDQLIVGIGKSMGGKQITPFKRTTVELED